MTVFKIASLTFGLLAFSFSAFAQNETTTPTTPAATTAAATATKFSCTMNGQMRTIEVVYENPNAKVPCKVDYTKNDGGTAGTPEALWTAANLEGYCEEKAAFFADKLKGNGWDCQ